MSRTLAVVGPTATGKSAIGIGLARRFGGEIINADALQVYRGLDIGTAKPSAAEQGQVRHHLIDVLDPDEIYSAGDFSRRGRSAIEEILGRGARPIVVGGSGFYVRALFEGLSEIPPPDLEVRRRLRTQAELHGLGTARAQLARLDPATEARLEEGDTQRVLRALEVVLSTGRPLSDWIAQKPSEDRTIEAIQVGLTLPRGILYDRIEIRVRRMVEAGWVAEVAGLLDRFDRRAPAFQAIGYRQIADSLAGKWSLDEAVRDTIAATRRFAKRQLTWFRKQSGVRWFSAEDLEHCLAEIETSLR